MVLDSDNTQTSRRRLLDAGKTLFAQHGYEQTSTSAIAREAGTSESQLMRYYGGKAGLLDAISNFTWAVLNQELQGKIAAAADAREALMAVFSTLLESFDADPEGAFLFVFEGRRVRNGGPEIALPKGFAEFQELMRMVVRRGRRDGTFAGGFNDDALWYALMGAMEALLRERVTARRNGQPEPFTDEELKDILAAMVAGLSPAQSIA
jgi:TetR/AcrR family transcriptional regulator